MAYSNKYTKEVEHTLNHLSLKNDKEKAEKLKKYLCTSLHVYGLSSQAQTELCKKGFNFFTDNKEDNFEVLHNVYLQSKSHEGKNQAFIYLDKHYKYIPVKTQLELLPTWINEVDNWAHSDYLSKFLTRLIEHADTQKHLLSLVKKWNASDNLWIRRQSLVSLYYYARTKKQHLEFELPIKLVTNLLHDNEYYVQKAVGWTLRESYNVYPKETYQFIEQNIKQIKPAAFTTCLEKMTEKQKLTLKAKRK
jgi:3-methyladenine DNA glycosylase AlkD